MLKIVLVSACYVFAGFSIFKQGVQKKTPTTKMCETIALAMWKEILVFQFSEHRPDNSGKKFGNYNYNCSPGNKDNYSQKL